MKISSPFVGLTVADNIWQRYGRGFLNVSYDVEQRATMYALNPDPLWPER